MLRWCNNSCWNLLNWNKKYENWCIGFSLVFKNSSWYSQYIRCIFSKRSSSGNRTHNCGIPVSCAAHIDSARCTEKKRPKRNFPVSNENLSQKCDDCMYVYDIVSIDKPQPKQPFPILVCQHHPYFVLLHMCTYGWTVQYWVFNINPPNWLFYTAKNHTPINGYF